MLQNSAENSSYYKLQTVTGRGISCHHSDTESISIIWMHITPEHVTSGRKALSNKIWPLWRHPWSKFLFHSLRFRNNFLKNGPVSSSKAKTLAGKYWNMNSDQQFYLRVMLCHFAFLSSPQSFDQLGGAPLFRKVVYWWLCYLATDAFLPGPHIRNFRASRKRITHKRTFYDPWLDIHWHKMT
jgi:hypothetical protein